MIASDAAAAAAASGLPPYDDELPDGFAHGFDTASASVVASADTGKPPPNALPIVTMSGTTPVWSTPHHVPVRPSPVIISSAISSAFASFAIDAIAGRNS